MTEIKRGTERPKSFDELKSLQSESRLTSAATNDNGVAGGTTVNSRKDAETIVVNVITENTKGPVSVTIKEEQV